MKIVRVVGILAAIFLILGAALFVLAGWGALVEYHALEWRGVQHKGASPLTRATGNLSYWFLGTGFLAGLFTFILRFTTTTRNTRKARNKHAEQNKTPSAEDREQMNL